MKVWKPIETAPKNRRVRLRVYGDNSYTGRWVPFKGDGYWSTQPWTWHATPTHWAEETR